MYYVLEGHDPMYPCRWIGESPYIEGVEWDLGQRHTVPVPEPLEFELEPLDPDASDSGPDMPDFFRGEIPLMSEALIAALKEAGVDNLDTYDAVIVDPDTGQRFTNYKAVNIIGAIAAADMAQSNATVHPGGPVLDVEFEGLAVDESRTGGALMFRLAENTQAILVHESVVEFLRSRGFDRLEFLDPGDVAL